MKKFLLLLLLTLLPMMASADNSGYCGANGRNLTWTYDEATKTLTISGTGQMASYYNDISPWSDFRASIKNIIIKDGVTSIGEEAFYSCKGLTSVTIPNSVTEIGDRAFTWCTNLTSVTIPNSVTSIGFSAFNACTGLTSVTIPNSVTSIGEWAFLACTGLTSIEVESDNRFYDSRNNCNAIIETATGKLIQGCISTVIPDDVTSIGDWAFAFCSGLTSVTIPNSVTSIGECAFEGCSGLTAITIPNSVTSIGFSAFNGCDGLTSVTIPNSVTSFSDAFRNCRGLTSVTIPNSVTEISNYAFAYCIALTSIIIPNSVTYIGRHAFEGCRSLTSVTIGNSVTKIDHEAFFDCSSLTQVVSYIKEPSDLQSSVFSNVPSSAILYVPVGCTEKYKSKSGWRSFKNIVEMVLNPVQKEQMSSIVKQITNDTYLNGNVVNGVYFCIDEKGGGYDGDENCIVLTEPTDDNTMESLVDEDIFSQEFKEEFNGIVFMVSPGKGAVKIVAETSGDMVMKVKIGHNQPISIQTDGKHESSFNFDVTENTYIYIYGGMNASNAKGIGKLSGENMLKIYDIEINSGATGIDYIEHPQQADVTIYNLGGQRMSKVQPGNVYIIRDQSGKNRKVLVK